MSGSQAARVRPTGVDLVVRLRLTHAAAVDLERMPDLLGPSAAAWLGDAIPDAPTGLRSYLCDLELHAGGRGPTLFRKAAIVSLAEPVRTEGGWRVPIEWRAASLSALFPVFSGQLVIEPDRLRLDGRYAPPGGRLGYLLDVALLGAAARQTGRWLMRRLAGALD